VKKWKSFKKFWMILQKSLSKIRQYGRIIRIEIIKNQNLSLEFVKNKGDFLDCL
jgi:hypothetical protein